MIMAVFCVYFTNQVFVLCRVYAWFGVPLLARYLAWVGPSLPGGLGLKLWYAGVPVGVVETLTIRGASFTTQKVGAMNADFYAWFGASQQVRYIFRADLLMPSWITLREWCDSNLWCLNRASWVGVLCRFPWWFAVSLLVKVFTVELTSNCLDTFSTCVLLLTLSYHHLLCMKLTKSCELRAYCSLTWPLFLTFPVSSIQLPFIDSGGTIGQK
jgi:hypothetical protein